uniref:Uncharacterized protein n=1 Tax=Oryza brachyantha TaxID=4533 RepID=J3LV44_ORYBR
KRNKQHRPTQLSSSSSSCGVGVVWHRGTYTSAIRAVIAPLHCTFDSHFFSSVQFNSTRPRPDRLRRRGALLLFDSIRQIYSSTFPFHTSLYR